MTREEIKRFSKRTSRMVPFNFKKYLVDHKMSLQDLAKRTGMTVPGVYSMCVRGTVKPEIFDRLRKGKS